MFDQFKKRLKDHRKQVRDRHNESEREKQALAHDRSLHPRKNKNHRGEHVFDLSAAKALLREDVRKGKHMAMLPSDLHRTRPEYMIFNEHLQAPNLPGSPTSEIRSLP